MDYSTLDKVWPLAAVCQLTSKNDKKINFEVVNKLLQKAKRTGAIMAFLPECFDYIGESTEESLALAEPLDGPLITAYREVARSMQMWLSLGGFHERVPNEKKCYNAHIVIDNKGEIVSVYRKVHLYDVDIPNRITLKESAFSRPGPTLGEPVATPIGSIGMLICYDLRFAEQPLLLRRAGAHILTYPSAFTVETGMSHWEPLLRARAIENQTYVIAAAQAGRHNARRVSFGHSMIVDPWGTVVAQCTDEMDVAVAEINLDRVEWVRNRMPVAQHRRYDLYGLSACGGGNSGGSGASSRSTTPNMLMQNVSTIEPEAVTKVEGKSCMPTTTVTVAVPVDTEDEGRGSDADPSTPPNNNTKSIAAATTAAQQPITTSSTTLKFFFSTIPIKPEHVFYYTTLTYAFVNLKPVLPGHVLVAPRRLVEHLHELSSEELSDLFRVVQLVERVVFRKFDTTSSTITLQNGPDAGQSVPHLHVHVIPRTRGDFEHNDDIYVELSREATEKQLGGEAAAKWPHNSSSRRKAQTNAVDSDRKPRTDEELTQEAAMLRKCFDEQQQVSNLPSSS